MARLPLPAAACVTGAVCLLAGCMSSYAPRTSEAPPGRAAPQPPAPVMSTESRKLKDHYAKVQESLLARDLLRTDGGGPDTPFTSTMLARNFERIALYEEYASIGGRIVARETSSKLHRWEDPVRIKVEFGGLIPREQRFRDDFAIRRYADRIGRVSGHPVSVVDIGAKHRLA